LIEAYAIELLGAISSATSAPPSGLAV
jgi:hypothetical protein